MAGAAYRLLLVADDPEDRERVRVLGPQPEGPVRRIRVDSLFELISRTVAMSRLEAIRQVAQEVERLDTQGVAGLAVRGLGSTHLFGTRLLRSPRWQVLEELTQGVVTRGWREVLSSLGYEIEALPKRGFLASSGGKPVIVIHPKRSAEQFARLDEAGRLPEGTLVVDCLAHGAPYGLLTADTRMRLLRAGRDHAGSTTRYVELDPAAMEPEYLPLVGLLAPRLLVDGEFEELLVEARDYGSVLRERLDRSLRQDVLPVLGRELGRWGATSGRDVANDETRSELEAAALTWVFRALFLLYAESAGHLPMSNHTYAGRSFTRIAERAIHVAVIPTGLAFAVGEPRQSGPEHRGCRRLLEELRQLPREAPVPDTRRDPLPVTGAARPAGDVSAPRVSPRRVRGERQGQRRSVTVLASVWKKGTADWGDS